MGYGMKYTGGGFPFKTNGEKDFLKNQNEEAVKSTDYLHRIPNPTVASDLAKKEYNKGGNENYAIKEAKAGKKQEIKEDEMGL